MKVRFSQQIPEQGLCSEKRKAGHGEGMLAFYTRQFNPYSCSVASVLIVLNCIRARRAPGGNTVPVTKDELLSKVRVANWREKVGTKGFNGRHGLSVNELGMAMETALKTYAIPYSEFVVVRIHPEMENPMEEKERLLALLSKMPENEGLYLLAHFTQGMYVGDWFGGHISPVGAFDPARREVFVLDVDQEIEGPYWVPFELFFEGLAGELKTLGTKGGGYVSFKADQ